MKYKILFYFLILSSVSEGAPFPATGTSLLTNFHQKAFFTYLPFEISPIPSILSPIPAKILSSSTTPDSMTFVSSSSKTASFSIRLEFLDSKIPLEKEARKWMKEYPSYGFQILGTQTLSFKGEKTMVIDMVQKEKQQQLRQLIVQSQQKIAIVTCFEEQKNFAQIIPTCNALLENLKVRPHQR